MKALCVPGYSLGFCLFLKIVYISELVYMLRENLNNKKHDLENNLL